MHIFLSNWLSLKAHKSALTLEGRLQQQGAFLQILYIFDGKGSNDISFNIKVFVGHMGNDLMRQYVGLAGKPRYHDGLEQTKGRGTCGRPRQITQVSMPPNPTNMKHHLKSGSAKIFCHEVKELTSIIISLDPARGFCTDHMKLCALGLQRWSHANGSPRGRGGSDASDPLDPSPVRITTLGALHTTTTTQTIQSNKYSIILSESQHRVQVRTKSQ